MPTIAIIDQYPIVRAGLDLFIKNNFKNASVLESDNLDNLLRSGHSKTPDLIVVGTTPGSTKNQCDVIARILRANRDTRVIVYDDCPDFAKLSLYFKSGVTGYITKSSGMDELLNCISDVQIGKKYISNEILDVMLSHWFPARDKGSVKSAHKLTPRENEIVNLLMDGDSVTTISKKLDRRTSTVSTIKKNIFKKLGITSLTELRDSMADSSNNHIVSF
ncbi:response regulator transcription factor [Dyadobacter sp. CY312]|uniref:response regulator transcription factor n=1 Tax=Dyadobacter sp. CY312 TaxID=2907303 RepID=UPI001F1C3958|nr:response regulator transcription factor [Dyadobacter sp. CY312]MCE7040431.1 response regulator transcription factor [Dyadobacter sp. CY312]